MLGKGRGCRQGATGKKDVGDGNGLARGESGGKWMTQRVKGNEVGGQEGLGEV